MAADLLEAVTGFLRFAMADDLGDTLSTPKVFSDYSGQVSLPYAVVSDVSETYEFQSGLPPTYIADGQMAVTFFADSKSQARSLGRYCILAFLQEEDAGDGALIFSDGQSLEFRPGQAVSQEISDVSAGQPAVFARIVTFHYREQFPTR